MNQFLAYIFSKIEEEKDIVEELIIIDNKVMLTSFDINNLTEFIKVNINEDQLINFKITTKTNILTEGNPLLILKIFNDFPDKILKLYINREYIGINKWLFQKSLEYYINLNMTLDFDHNYLDYIDNDNVTIIGSKEFAQTIEEIFVRETTKYLM